MKNRLPRSAHPGHTVRDGRMTPNARRRYGRWIGSMLMLLWFALPGASAWAEATGSQRGQWFDALDANGDDVIDRQELEMARRETFARADTDDDGYVTTDEAAGLRDPVMAAAASSGRGGWMRERMATRQKTQDMGQQAAGRIARLDTDGDGRISEAEFVVAENPLVERIDRNGDGLITREEIDESGAALRSGISAEYLR